MKQLGPQAVVRTLGACMEVAPGARVQEAFNRMVFAMQGDDRTEDDICLALMEAAVDGLRNGNWPTN